MKKVMPNNVAFMSGWMLWFAYVVACSLYAKGFGSYFLEFFHRYVPDVTEFLVSMFGHEGSVALLTVAVGVLFLAINIIGTHASGQAENVITLAKLAVLSVFIAFGISAVVGVVREQPCDVAVLKSEPGELVEIRRLLIPIAGRERHDRLKIRLVHALQGTGADGVTFLTVVPPDASALRRRTAQATLDRQARLYGIRDAALVVDSAVDVAGAVTERAKNADLVILGMREEPWFKAFFFGRLAEQIAGQAGCPVLLTKTRAGRRSLVKRWLP